MSEASDSLDHLNRVWNSLGESISEAMQPFRDVSKWITPYLAALNKQLEELGENPLYIICMIAYYRRDQQREKREQDDNVDEYLKKILNMIDDRFWKAFAPMRDPKAGTLPDEYLEEYKNLRKLRKIGKISNEGYKKRHGELDDKIGQLLAHIKSGLLVKQRNRFGDEELYPGLQFRIGRKVESIHYAEILYIEHVDTDYGKINFFGVLGGGYKIEDGSLPYVINHDGHEIAKRVKSRFQTFLDGEIKEKHGGTSKQSHSYDLIYADVLGEPQTVKGELNEALTAGDCYDLMGGPVAKRYSPKNMPWEVDGYLNAWGRQKVKQSRGGYKRQDVTPTKEQFLEWRARELERKMDKDEDKWDGEESETYKWETRRARASSYYPGDLLNSDNGAEDLFEAIRRAAPKAGHRSNFIEPLVSAAEILYQYENMPGYIYKEGESKGAVRPEALSITYPRFRRYRDALVELSKKGLIRESDLGKVDLTEDEIKNASPSLPS